MAISKILKEIVMIEYPLPEETTITVNGVVLYDITSLIPNGRRPISLINERWGSNSYFYISDIMKNYDGTWQLRIFNMSTSSIKVRPKFHIVCV